MMTRPLTIWQGALLVLLTWGIILGACQSDVWFGR
jgi:hypothetical protein